MSCLQRWYGIATSVGLRRPGSTYTHHGYHVSDMQSNEMYWDFIGQIILLMGDYDVLDDFHL